MEERVGIITKKKDQASTQSLQKLNVIKDHIDEIYNILKIGLN